MLKSFIFSIVGFLMLLIPAVFAFDQFRTEYDITYTVEPDTVTWVDQKITVTNLKDDVIATNYVLGVKQLEIFDIEANDSQGKMEITEVQEESVTKLVAKFNENIIGRGRSNTFNFSYKSRDIANQVGEVYNIRIPKVADLNLVKEYKVKLIVPKTFGPKLYVTPAPKKQAEDDTTYHMEFDKADLEKTGISASFGKFQTLNYKLIYQLENKAAVSSLHEIALPPDIQNKQQVNHHTLDPQPISVHQDDDGNLIAVYKLKALSTQEVILTGSVKLMGAQINPELGGAVKDIPDEIAKEYTTEKEFWEINSVEIQTLKNKLYEEDATVVQNAQKIYTFILETLTYDYAVVQKDYVERSGAVKALLATTPIACMEFTDLFIAVARSMGIPARELNGYAINTQPDSDLPLSIKLKSGDLLHAWPEFYDPNLGWIQIDPTWGKTSGLDYFTKLDTSHFVFSIKGKDSNYPLPAGMYRLDDTKQLVEVQIAQDEQNEEFKYSPVFKKKFNFNIVQVVRGYSKYQVKNLGGTYIYGLETAKGQETLLPYEVKNVYLKRKFSTVNFKSFNAESITQKLVLTRERLTNSAYSPLAIAGSFFAGIFITICAYLLKNKAARKQKP